MIKTNQTSIWYPRYIATSALDIAASELKLAGISHLALDIDETLVPRGHNKLADSYIAHLSQLENAGFQLLVVSNSRRDLQSIAQHFHAPIVRPTRGSFKPLPHYYQQVIAMAGTEPAHIAMVGDRLINDVIGGNLVGLVTIMVEPYARQQQIHHRWYFRRALSKS